MDSDCPHVCVCEFPQIPRTLAPKSIVVDFPLTRMVALWLSQVSQVLYLAANYCCLSQRLGHSIGIYLHSHKKKRERGSTLRFFTLA